RGDRQVLRHLGLASRIEVSAAEALVRVRGERLRAIGRHAALTNGGSHERTFGIGSHPRRVRAPRRARRRSVATQLWMGAERRRRADRAHLGHHSATATVTPAAPAVVNSGHWYDVFAFTRDGISGSELLGLTLVLGMVLLLMVVQIKETGSSKKLDFAWIFLDQGTNKVSRSGVMA